MVFYRSSRKIYHQAFRHSSYLKYIVHSINIKLLFDIVFVEFKAVLKSKAFQELSDESMNEILQSDNLQMDEIELLKYVKDWATINSVST